MSAPYICMYLDYLETFLNLSEAARGRLVTAMLHYAATGEEPQLKGKEQVVWPQLRGQLQRDLDKYESRCIRNRINGAKGGRPKQEKEQPTGIFWDPKKPNTNTNTKTNTNINTNTNTNTNTTPPGLLGLGAIL